MNKAAPFFIKLNAFLAAKKILATEDELPEPLLTLAWETPHQDLMDAADQAAYYSPHFGEDE